MIELGTDYLQCGLVDPSGATAGIFRAVKIEEARQLVATAKSRPSVQAQIKGNQRVKELQEAEAARERERAPLCQHLALSV
jgi:sRNA-binding protein